jgi:hypothetical protein
LPALRERTLFASPLTSLETAAFEAPEPPVALASFCDENNLLPEENGILEKTEKWI